LLEEKRGIWKRYIVGALLIVAAAATATSVAAFNVVNEVVTVFRHGAHITGLEKVLAQADSGAPQTILLIGSDQRAKGSNDAKINGTGARSDTMMLVRLDPRKRATALMSLPRDLKVQIPGHGTDKLNAAYAIGGPKLTVKTIKGLTGIPINHVINVDFRGFRAGVDKVGCVWIDVDRRYYNVNSGAGGYATINIQPGYQKLCGGPALAYVRYRHTDNDIVRGARQQGFLRQAKDQLGVGRIYSNRKGLLNIFGKYTSSDIRDRSSVLRILKLVIQSAGHPFVQIPFKSELGPSYVTASAADIEGSAQQFLGVKAPKKALKPAQTRKKHGRHKAQTSTGLIGASSEGKSTALQLVSNGVRGIRVYYPRKREPSDVIQGPPRAYKVAIGGRLYPAYRMVVKMNGIGDYWGVQGVGWTNPPILREASTVKKIGHRKFFIYADGARVRLVAWKTRDAVYWVSNSLEQTLTRAQMLAIASSTKPL
jgi:polyisoprenyl-teichoic acid--peptidoglycan teichoic acid transferase